MIGGLLKFLFCGDHVTHCRHYGQTLPLPARHEIWKKIRMEIAGFSASSMRLQLTITDGWRAGEKNGIYISLFSQCLMWKEMVRGGGIGLKNLECRDDVGIETPTIWGRKINNWSIFMSETGGLTCSIIFRFVLAGFMRSGVWWHLAVVIWTW